MFRGEFFCAKLVKLKLVVWITALNVKVCDVCQVLLLIIRQVQVSSFCQLHKLVNVRHSLVQNLWPKMLL